MVWRSGLAMTHSFCTAVEPSTLQETNRDIWVELVIIARFFLLEPLGAGQELFDPRRMHGRSCLRLVRQGSEGMCENGSRYRTLTD